MYDHNKKIPTVQNNLSKIENDYMSPNSTICINVNSNIKLSNIKTGNLNSNVKNGSGTQKLKNKYHTEEGTNGKNMTSHKLQKLSLQYDMTRREIYEMHSTWHSMLEFTANFLKRKG